MNILPKKRWHVRTKDNIARIRRDEAIASEEEQERMRRKQLAEKEARINKLRCRKGYKEIQQSGPYQQEVNTGHVNLFEDHEAGIGLQNFTNKRSSKGLLAKNQNHETQMVLPTFLGQGTNEALKIKSWYELPPQRFPPCSIYSGENKSVHENDYHVNIQSKSGESKQAEEILKASTYKEKKKEKSQNPKNSVSQSLEKMRKDRLKRETLEKSRQDLTLLKAKGLIVPAIKPCPPKVRDVKPKYSSQFNPHIARQNMK